MSLLQEIKVPLLAVNDTTLTVVEVPFKSGDKVNVGVPIIVFETSKTTYQVEAEASGFIQYLCEAGKEYEVNDVVARIFTEEKEVKKTFEDVPPITNGIEQHKSLPEDAQWNGDTLFSAEAEDLISARKIDRNLFRGCDMVSRQDVEMLFTHEIKPAKGPPLKTNSLLPASADINKVIVEKLGNSKKKEIGYLSEVQTAGLTSTVNMVVETKNIFIHINKSLQYLKNSLLPVILYETGRLLQKYPVLNAYFASESIAYYKNVHVGFAIDIDKGLKVLRIPETNKKSISEIEQHILQLSNKYLDDTLALDDLVDITFTITDLSSENVSFFTPLINMMNSAILGISSVDQKLNRCILSMTFDHRVTEGKTVAKFLSDLKARLESYRAIDGMDYLKNIYCYRCYKTLKDNLGDIGFVKSVTLDGEEGYLCQSCIKGF